MKNLIESWGRFSAKGSDLFEEKMTDTLKKIALHFNDFLNPKEFQSLVLLGGYGRGEGGVLNKGNSEEAHNNLDFILISRNISSKRSKTLQEEIDLEIIKINQEITSIAIDLSIISSSKLASSSPLMIWYDMRHGHKTILGDPNFVPMLKQFTLESIPKWDARNLLINRGTLLIINDLILEKKSLSETDEKLIIKHAIKAIIGYGDALLFFKGKYHWSYVEKLKRIEALDEINKEFKNLYIEAANFRFTPNYDKYLKYDLKTWMSQLRLLLSPVMLECEKVISGKSNLSWNNYLDGNYSSALFDKIKLKQLVRKFLNVTKSSPPLRLSSWKSKLGYRSLDKGRQLTAFFPLIAYELDENGYKEAALNFLNATSDKLPDLRKAYLNFWGTHVDVNFKHVIKKFELAL
ncbi:MAG: hypothetical protein NE330_22870 [Lentisphaeraceae bacterium]|nr:hypothetical protein [Lentisphaeraceae bacterium]